MKICHRETYQRMTVFLSCSSLFFCTAVLVSLERELREYKVADHITSERRQLDLQTNLKLSCLIISAIAA